MPNIIRHQPDKLQKYRDYYAGEYVPSEEEQGYLLRYERVIALIDFGKAADDGSYTGPWKRAEVVKFIQDHYHVSMQMSNRIVNEAMELYGDIHEMSLRAKKSFRIQHLEKREAEAAQMGDYIASARLNDQINKLMNAYDEIREEDEDQTDYSVPASISYEAIDTPYEDVSNKPVQSIQSGDQAESLADPVSSIQSQD
jgi:hypothetical protein